MVFNKTTFVLIIVQGIMNIVSLKKISILKYAEAMISSGKEGNLKQYERCWLKEALHFCLYIEILGCILSQFL